VDFTIEPQFDDTFALKLATDEWEVNLRAAGDEFVRLADIRAAEWVKGRSIRAGESAGAAAFWARTGDGAALMIGRDDETWDISFEIPLDVISRIVAEVRRLMKLPPESTGE
jgi:hypothetical protein